jgi:hypothetical protein
MTIDDLHLLKSVSGSESVLGSVFRFFFFDPDSDTD